MTAEEKAGKVQTVLGLIEPAALGVTMTHEHLLCDVSVAHEVPHEASAKALFDQPLSLDNLGYVRHYNAPNLDNALLLDENVAIEEARLYKRLGGDSMVDATSIGIARDPDALARISRASEVQVVMGSSYYVGDAHPEDMDSRTEQEIVDEIVRDVNEGAGQHLIRSGIIGEVGCSWPLQDNERKVLRASARAQRLTGAPMLIHPGRDETAPLEIIDVLAEADADLNRTIIGHLDRTVFERSTLTSIAESGCFLEWDLFGRETSYYWANPAVDMPSDAKRIDDIAWLCSEGYSDKIVIAQDICTKDRLVKYGGHGYGYIPSQIAPRMRARGMSEDDVDRILRRNPAAALTFASPSV